MSRINLERPKGTNLFKERLLPENPTAEEARSLGSIDAMRERLKEHEAHSPLMRHVAAMARHMNLSDEEKMFLLAFHAINSYEAAMEAAIEKELLRPAPCVMLYAKRFIGEPNE